MIFGVTFHKLTTKNVDKHFDVIIADLERRADFERLKGMVRMLSDDMARSFNIMKNNFK